MEIKIKHKVSGETLFKCEADSLRLGVEMATETKADLRSADLRSADLDFSAWPLWCGSKQVKVDIKFVYQFALKSHRAEDLGVDQCK